MTDKKSPPGENPGCLARDCPTHHTDDVITVRELREALFTVHVNNTWATRGYTDKLADQIMKHAADSREPEYSPGTVVRDAKGTFFLRVKEGWQMFGLAHPFTYGFPQRPLEVISDHRDGTVPRVR